jgi:hypothetical protein
VGKSFSATRGDVFISPEHRTPAQTPPKCGSKWADSLGTSRARAQTSSRGLARVGALCGIDVTAIPSEAAVSLDNGTPMNGLFHTAVPADRESHVLRVWAPGYQTRTISLGTDDSPPDAGSPRPRTAIDCPRGTRPRPSQCQQTKKSRRAI